MSSEINSINCGTWALTRTEEDSLNAFQLSPKTIEKDPQHYKSYRLAGVSLVIFYEETDIPANKATRAYFIPNCNKLRGRPKTTLPMVLNRNLEMIQHPNRPHSSKNLAEITGHKKLEGINITE